MEPVYGYIYRIYSVKNDRSGKHYIGQTKHTPGYRFKKHVTRAAANDEKPQCWALNNAIRKYGAANMRVEPVLHCRLEDLNFWEVFFIECEQTLAPKGYNLNRGGANRKECMSEYSKDKISESRRIHTAYNLPRGVVEVDNPFANKHGFIVIKRDGSRTCFVSAAVSMADKHKLAMDCHRADQSGRTYVSAIKHKRGTDRLEIPMYISKQGENGFAVHKPNWTRKSFRHKGNTREQNLANAKAYLNSLP